MAAQVGYAKCLGMVQRIVQHRPYKIKQCFCPQQDRHQNKVGVVVDFKIPPSSYWWLEQEKLPRLAIYQDNKREICWNPVLEHANTANQVVEPNSFDTFLRRK